jgi:hypothetical protein
LLLSNAIFEPVVTHVKGFRLFHADLSMENAVSSGIVSLKRSSRLWMAHFYEREQDRQHQNRQLVPCCLRDNGWWHWDVWRDSPGACCRPSGYVCWRGLCWETIMTPHDWAKSQHTKKRNQRMRSQPNCAEMKK